MFPFPVLCNNPKKYAVVEPEGRIESQKCADIVVRHVAVNGPGATQQTDKFRIQMVDPSLVPSSSPGDERSHIMGRRDVLATLHPGTHWLLSRFFTPLSQGYFHLTRGRGLALEIARRNRKVE